MNFLADTRRRRRLKRLRRFFVRSLHPQVTRGVERELTAPCNAGYTHREVSPQHAQVCTRYSEGTYTMGNFVVQNSKQKEPPQ
jgi:hypothetical protein